MESKNNKIKIAVCIPMKSERDWIHLSDCHLLTTFLPSFLRTCERRKYDYTFYLGYDKGDAFFEKYHNELKKRFLPDDKLFCKDGFRGNPCGYWNYLFKQAFKDGNDYLAQYGDDISIISNNWTTYFVNILREHGDFGVCGGCDTRYWIERLERGQIGILENIFIHKSHFDYFNTVFDKRLKTWWSDDYISNLYNNYTYCCPNIRYRNVNRVGDSNNKSRYTPDQKDGDLWQNYVKDTYKSIKNKSTLPKDFVDFITSSI
tara:strand:+ start:63 stop:842 length:780 start_codon:yes stop_codon:yes gene_type:complete